MRKTTENMLHAIRNPGPPGTQRRIGNTTVTHARDGVIEVRLHGNLISLISPDTVRVNLAGWDTQTTRDRLDAIAFAFARHHVSRVKGRTQAWPTAMAKGATPTAVDMPHSGAIALPRWDA